VSVRRSSPNTATTYAFLPACDAVLFVTSVDTPRTTPELVFLGDVRQHVRKIFFVVNKTDRLAGRERGEALAFITRMLRQHMKTQEIRVFPLSCRLGLAAKRDGDAGGYRASGLAALEDALTRFLSEEKTATCLAAVADRAIRLVADEAGEGGLYRRARMLPESTRTRRLDALRARLREHATVRAGIARALRDHVLDQAGTVARSAVQTFVIAEQERLERQLDRVLAHCSWQPSWVVARRLEEHTHSRLRRHVRQC
jgi:hypothetical protein